MAGGLADPGGAQLAQVADQHRLGLHIAAASFTLRRPVTVAIDHARLRTHQRPQALKVSDHIGAVAGHDPQVAVRQLARPARQIPVVGVSVQEDKSGRAAPPQREQAVEQHAVMPVEHQTGKPP